jgi:hypothetical protein
MKMYVFFWCLTPRHINRKTQKHKKKVIGTKSVLYGLRKSFWLGELILEAGAVNLQRRRKYQGFIFSTYFKYFCEFYGIDKNALNIYYFEILNDLFLDFHNLQQLFVRFMKLSKIKKKSVSYE